MTTKRKTADARLRRRAEASLRKHPKDASSPRTEGNAKRLLHELQVHQVELEMQNAELRAARVEIEAGLEKYTDLYDFAPVGYLSLDQHGLILDLNLTAAAMLGAARSRLINRSFQAYIARSSQPLFLAFLEEVFARQGRRICEMSLLPEVGAPFLADVQATAADSLQGARKWCRVAISDITTLKRAEEARRRLEDLTISNRKLQAEIVQRQVVETALKKSRARQGRLLEEARAMQSQLRHLSHQVLQAQEEERKRISRELHDQVAQALVAINVHLAALTQEVSDNPKRLKQKIARTQRLVEKSVDIVHRFARELRPMVLDDLGLTPALHSFMKDFTTRTGIRIHFTTFAPDANQKLNNAKRTALYRVAQEALINVARHSEASHVKVTVQARPGAIELEIADDGKGFSVNQVLVSKRQGRLGVIGMRERVQMIGGRFSLESTPGKGATVRAWIPTRNVRGKSVPLRK